MRWRYRLRHCRNLSLMPDAVRSHEACRSNQSCAGGSEILDSCLGTCGASGERPSDSQPAMT
jgi:hypothetical protein